MPERFTRDPQPFLPYDNFARSGISVKVYIEMRNKYCDINGRFCTLTMLEDYCKRDVDILRVGFDRFLNIVH